MNYKRSAVLTALALSLAIGSMLFVNKNSSAATSCVNPGGTGGCFSSIQAAVNAASPGDTINVAAGAYAESVLINKALTLNGAQAGNAFAGRSFGGAFESTVTGQFTITAANVTIDGFSLTNSVPTFAVFGIVVKNGGNDALVTNNIINTVKTADTGPNGTAQAIYLENGPDNVSILDNKISNVQSNRSAKGVLIGSNGGTDPSLNTIVQGNSITSITSDTRGAYGVSVANVPGVSGLEIRNNIIKDLNGGGWAHAVGLEGDTPGVVVEGNCISNIIDLTPSMPEDAIAVWFESNPSFSTAEVHQNNFENVSYGIAVHPALSGSPVDGANNWWGSADGPGPVGPGSGAKVSPNVTYSPWLIARALGGACGGAEVTNKDQCKNGGWKTFFRADGTSFKNQGDCVSYVNTGK